VGWLRGAVRRWDYVLGRVRSIQPYFGPVKRQSSHAAENSASPGICVTNSIQAEEGRRPGGLFRWTTRTNRISKRSPANDLAVDERSCHVPLRGHRQVKQGVQRVVVVWSLTHEVSNNQLGSFEGRRTGRIVVILLR